jgi:hypothetical protein
MRLDVAVILAGMGYANSDFLVSQDSPTSVSFQWFAQSPRPTEAEIEAAALPTYRALRTAQINAECRARLLARFGDPAEQVSRSIGIYGLAEKSALETGIAATIDASNSASDAVTAATTIAEVEAVTVMWPVI